MFDLSSKIYTIAMSIPGFLIAICVHEAAHAWMANRYGDTTAKDAGRLTLNPAAHYDMMGTVILPLVFALMGFAVIGWAKPVPVDVRRFSDARKGIFWVSFAGPLSNIIVGFLSALALAIIATKVSSTFSYYMILISMLKYSIFINFILAFFNLIPLPPLDGSKMVASYLNYEKARKYEELGRYTNMIFMGAFALSIMGIPIFGYILYPATFLSNYLTIGLVRLFS
jgi:Zn-dependent protease